MPDLGRPERDAIRRAESSSSVFAQNRHQHSTTTALPPTNRGPVRTLPNSPLVHALEPKSSHSNLPHIRSAGKFDIRSPIIPENSVLFTPGGINEGISSNLHVHDSASSLYTSRTNATVASRLLSIAAAKTLYTLRNYYNDFTTIDWAKAFISTNRFNYELEKNTWIQDDYETSESTSGKRRTPIPFYYKSYLVLGKWVLIVIIGFVFSLIAFAIDKFEILLIGFKHGYCRTNWFASQVSCCANSVAGPTSSESYPSSMMYMNVFKSGYLLNTRNNLEVCPDWISWSAIFSKEPLYNLFRFDFLIYVVLTVVLAQLACIITLSTKLTGGVVVSPPKQEDVTHLSTGNDKTGTNEEHHESSSSDDDNEKAAAQISPRVMYSACGSGVPEVKTILSGFVIRRFLGTYTLFAKTITLVLAIASGMALGKEGPYVHLATAVGNIASRFFPFIESNNLLKKQILSASASAGVALAFGSPLGGVLFILEEINHYLPSHHLFQIFFCAIISTLFLKFLNPYGTGNTVLFELKYNSDWSAIELLFFVGLGIAGGLFGASFVKFVQWWPKKFRTKKLIKDHPVFEVFCIALLTGLITFWNPYTKQAASELVLDLATPCGLKEIDGSLCPATPEQYIKEIGSLIFAFVVKVILTFVTFGLKVPCGIYVPSMVAGALYGRICAMLIQLFNLKYNLNIVDVSSVSTTTSVMRFICSSKSDHCVDMGIYSMISAGAFMAGVTRMNITLVIILFELTSSYTYVLPISISIAVANWAGGLLEKNSLYETMLIMNDYPFMSSETEAIDPFLTAGDIIHATDKVDEDVSRVSSISRIDEIPTIEISRDLSDHDHDHANRLYLDVSESPYVPASLLQSKFILLVDQGLLDGCLPLIKNQVCVGLLFFSDLELCLDKLKGFCSEYEVVDEIYCKLLVSDGYDHRNNDTINMHERHNSAVVQNIQGGGNQMDYFSYGSIDNGVDYLVSEVLESFTNLTQYVDYSPIFINYDSELSFAHLIFDKIGNRVIVLLKNGHFYGVLHKKVLIDYCRRVT
ncbi:hypothetical protein G9P44_003242 [Scheffersomyces stipitis]|nr:hypothetical protein G9P44_003242 [Scheffersomyces stipitis]